jgi:alkylated DNA repair dioxygenase AlkB
MSGALPACFSYRPGWVTDADQVLDELSAAIAWEQNDITIAGRTIPIPRLTCWMGDAALRAAQHSAYVYSGVRNELVPMPPQLELIKKRLEDETGAAYNSCLANLYRDGRDSLSYHSDDEPELGPRPTIASVSLGDRRRFQLKHVASGQRWTLDLGAGDLLIMTDESQSDYRHAVPKTTRPIGPRLNLTFRFFHTS